MTLIDLYYKIMRDFDDSNEMVSIKYECYFGSSADVLFQGNTLFNKTKNAVLETRKDNELHYHNFLKHQLFSRLQEIKYYSHVDIEDTRRLVATSAGCISSIHLLVRDAIHVNAYFRSSDFDGAFPADVEFLCTLPQELVYNLTQFKGVDGYEEVTDELINNLNMKPIKLNMMFGSLHRTI